MSSKDKGQEQTSLPFNNGANGTQNGHSDVAEVEENEFFQVEITPPLNITKRDGRVVPFDVKRIENALRSCFNSLKRKPSTPVEELAQQVVNIISAKYEEPTVESVQDVVEMVLQAAKEYEASKHYILYRADHAKKRQERPIPENVRQAFNESDAYFPTQLQKFQFYDKYSRFNYELGRRETWIENS